MKLLTQSPPQLNNTEITPENQTISNGTSKLIEVGEISVNANISLQPCPSSETIIGPPCVMANRITAKRNDAYSITVTVTPQG
jgi:hypothetical protein